MIGNAFAPGLVAGCGMEVGGAVLRRFGLVVGGGTEVGAAVLRRFGNGGVYSGSVSESGYLARFLFGLVAF